MISLRVSSYVLAVAVSIGLLFSMPSAEAAEGKININTASLEQIEAVKGIGHDVAQKILAYKQEHGAFNTPEDLGKVKGVGKVRLRTLQESFTVGSTPATPGEQSAKK